MNVQVVRTASCVITSADLLLLHLDNINGLDVICLRPTLKVNFVGVCRLSACWWRSLTFRKFILLLSEGICVDVFSDMLLNSTPVHAENLVHRYILLHMFTHFLEVLCYRFFSGDFFIIFKLNPRNDVDRLEDFVLTRVRKLEWIVLIYEWLSLKKSSSPDYSPEFISNINEEFALILINWCDCEITVFPSVLNDMTVLLTRKCWCGKWTVISRTWLVHYHHVWRLDQGRVFSQGVEGISDWTLWVVVVGLLLLEDFLLYSSTRC